MKIAICDDNIKDRNTLLGHIQNALSRHSIEAELLLFESGEAMLAAMQNEIFPINFLDIYMEGVTGITVAREIRIRSNTAAIVITTSSGEHMADGFDVGAVHYLVKPFRQSAVDVAFDRCIQIVGSHEKYIELTVNRQNKKILLSHIIAVESWNKSCIVRTKDAELRPYIRLDALAELLYDPRFLRCHRSFIINMDYAVRVQANDFVMVDGTHVPIRREDRARTKELFEDYCFDKTRRRL